MYSKDIENIAEEIYNNIKTHIRNFTHKRDLSYIDFYEVETYFDDDGDNIKEIICKHIQQLTQNLGGIDVAKEARNNG